MALRRIKVYWEITKKFFEVELANGARNLYAQPFVLYNVKFVVDKEAKHRPQVVNGERNVHAYAEGDVLPWTYDGQDEIGRVTYDPRAGDTFLLHRAGINDQPWLKVVHRGESYHTPPLIELPMPIDEIECGVLVFDIVLKNGVRSPRMRFYKWQGFNHDLHIRHDCWLSDTFILPPRQTGVLPTSQPDLYPNA